MSFTLPPPELQQAGGGDENLQTLGMLVLVICGPNSVCTVMVYLPLVL
jgi:hypothetical protein